MGPIKQRQQYTINTAQENNWPTPDNDPPLPSTPPPIIYDSFLDQYFCSQTQITEYTDSHMKLFSEFASCWSGATVSPTADPAGARRQTEDQRDYGRRTCKRTAKVSGAAANWKPKLNAISENSPMSDAAGIDVKKRQVKAKPRSPAKAAPPSSLVEDHWKYSQTMALPAFAPTSYLF